MNTLMPEFRKEYRAICLLGVIALLLFACGCTQPSSPQQSKAPAPVTATQTDNSHITVAYPGSTDTNDLLELEVSITDSTGKTQTKSVGDRHSTTPLKWGATLPMTGTFSANDRVVVTGYFMDSSHRQLLDTVL